MRALATLTAAAVTTALFALSTPGHAADIAEVSSQEFYAAAYYKDALEDPRIQKIKSDKKRLARIARSIKMKPSAVMAAVEKVDGLIGDPGKLAVDSIKSGFKGTRVAGRVLDVLINATEPKHVVAYVRFRGTKATEVIKDASMIAHVVANKAPLVSTLSLSAIHPKAAATSKKSVWAAKVSIDRAGNIDPKRIDDYAERLYKRLFEIVETRPF